MTRQMHDIVMLSDEQVTIERESYSLEEGDVVSLSFKTARNYVNQFGIARWHGDKYPVRDDDYLDEVGPTGENVEDDSSGDNGSGEKDGRGAGAEEYDLRDPEKVEEYATPLDGCSYDRLQDIAKANEIPANQKKVELVEEIEEKVLGGEKGSGSEDNEEEHEQDE